ncbi:hypothetical protein F5Y14DRAFT_406934 [Nemania sp. NC0429]|nr:hypothetical protein F5Y14DRAFT_406934 [Nemania sp. NC0429]
MGTRGLEIVRFRGRYYIRYHQYDTYYEGLGAQIVASIPAAPDKYQEWLEQMRAKYAAKQDELEKHVYEIRDDGSEPDDSYFDELLELPSELPRRMGYYWDIEYYYIINLDREVLTMNFGIHWKLSHIPRNNNLWIEAIAESIYQYKPTISLDICPDEYIASTALEPPENRPDLNYCIDLVAPRTGIASARTAFLTRMLAEVIIQYKFYIIRLGMEWSPASFPFRELVFALVSIASGTARFFSLPAGGECDPCSCEQWGRKSDRLPQSCGFLDAPLLQFGSMSHRPGDAPGVSPPETMYWHEDVLVSLAMTLDGAAVKKAVDWGLEQGRRYFQIVVLSLFQATFAEVFFDRESDDDGEPVVRVSEPIHLSPLRQHYCMSTHPRERPELKDGMDRVPVRGEQIMRSNCTGTAHRLQSQFPGLAALVNFFEVAATRRSTSKSEGVFPPELYDRILDFVDYDTWRVCNSVSTKFRYACLSRFRIDEDTRIFSGPFVRLQQPHRKEPLLSFNFQDVKTGDILPAVQNPRLYSTKRPKWMPIVGSDRKALMSDVVTQFEPAVGIPVEEDYSEEDCNEKDYSEKDYIKPAYSVGDDSEEGDSEGT